jgi:hypothetical protein
MSEDGVVRDLIQRTRLELQTGRKFNLQSFPLDHQIDSAMAHVHERLKLVEREKMLHPVAQTLGDVARVFRKRLGRIARLPAFVLQFLR